MNDSQVVHLFGAPYGAADKHAHQALPETLRQADAAPSATELWEEFWLGVEAPVKGV